ncbi:hypothetical protein JCM8547_008222 [Rhodosporidiobolus lusitaniae]
MADRAGALNASPAIPPAQPQREKAKRGARACTQCRRLKKTCEGGSAPCVRCKASGSECVFDKPASSVVEDAGLSRLSAIEAALATNERRMDSVVQQMGEISNVLSEVLSRLRSSTSGATASNPAPHPYPPSSASTFSTTFEASPGTSAPPGPLALPPFAQPIPAPNHSTPPAAFQPFSSVPVFPSSNSAHSSPSLPKPPSLEPARRSSAPHTHVPSGLDALASLASSKSGEIHRFASRINAPLTALADAAAQLSDDDVDVKPDVRAEEAAGEREPVAGPSGQRAEDGQPLAKKSKLSAPPAAKTADQFDLVAKGLMSDKDARALILLFMKECQPFCSVLDPAYDTYESLRRRSAFLFNVMIYAALRAQERNAPPSKELVAAAEETRRFAQNQVFRDPALEDVQAVFIMACYHQSPYILSGMGLRLALSARFDTTWEQIEAHGVEKTDEKARRLTAQFRTWNYVLQLDFKHSRYSGRQLLVQQEDLDAVIANADKLITLPLAQFTDIRHVGNLRLIGIEREILNGTAALAASPKSLQELIDYAMSTKTLIEDWYTHYDAIIAKFEPSPLAWPRRSHLRMYHDANLFLFSNTFKHRLLEGAATASPEQHQIAALGLAHARADLQTVLNSPVYREGTRWSGYMLRVDLTFAAIFLLKSAAAYPHLIERDEVAGIVAQLAELLSNIAGSQRYSAMLRAAREQYLTRTDTALSSSSAATAAANASLPPAADATPASLRSILVPPLSTISNPLPSFTSGVPAFASSSTAGSIPSFAANSPFSLSSASNGLLTAVSAPGGVDTGLGTAALLPGEEIDWSLSLPPSLFDDPGIPNTDWTAGVGGLPNWLVGL